MTSIVKSVEVVDLTLSSATTVQADLTKGQDETMCVPIFTQMATGGNPTDNFANRLAEIWFDDNAGTARINAKREVNGTAGTFVVKVFVVEFDSTFINVYSGTSSLSGTTVTSGSFTAVDQAKAFALTNWRYPTSPSDDHNDSLVRTRFASDTTLTLERGASGGTLECRWYVVECKNTEFAVQYKNITLSSSATSNTVAVTSVDLTKTFIIGGHETSEGADDLRDGENRYYLTSATVLSILRDDGGAPTSSQNADVFVVEAGDDEFTSEKFDVDTTSNASTTQAITSIDQANSILVPGYTVGQSTGSVNSTAGGAIDNNMSQLRFSADDEVTIQRLSGTNSQTQSFTVVEWLIGAAAAENTIAFALGLNDVLAKTGIFQNARVFSLGLAATHIGEIVLGIVENTISFAIGLADSKVAQSIFNPTRVFSIGFRSIKATAGIFNNAITFGLGLRDTLASLVARLFENTIVFAIGLADSKAINAIINAAVVFATGLRDTIFSSTVYNRAVTFGLGLRDTLFDQVVFVFENSITFGLGLADSLIETARRRWELTERAITNWAKSIGISGIWNKTERSLTGWTKNPDTSDTWSKTTDSDDTWKKTEED